MTAGAVGSSVKNKTANTFELHNVDSTNYGTFTSGGSFKRIVETATTYVEADLFDLDYAQTNDTLTVAHADYKPREITRSSDAAWSIADATFKDGPYLDEPTTDHARATPDATGAIACPVAIPALAQPSGGPSSTTALSGPLPICAPMQTKSPALVSM